MTCIEYTVVNPSNQSSNAIMLITAGFLIVCQHHSQNVSQAVMFQNP